MFHRFWYILVGLVLLLRFVYVTFSYVSGEVDSRKNRRLHGLVSPKQLRLLDPFFGTDLNIAILNQIRQHRLLEGLDVRFKNHGSTHAFRMGSTSIIATCDPENIKALSTDPKTFAVGEVRRKSLSILHGRGIFAVEGTEWQQSRAALRPCFAKGQHDDIAVLENHFQKLLKRLEHGNDCVDMQAAYHRLTMDTAMQYFFGISPEQSFTSTRVEEFMANIEYVNDSVYYSLVFGPHSPISIWRFWSTKKAMRIIHCFVEDQVDRALNAEDYSFDDSKNRYVFLHELCKTVDDPQLLRDQVLTSMLGGKDTTASLLSHVTFELARNPAILTKLQREVEKLSGDAFSITAIRGLKYVRYCLLEGLRLYTVVPINMRCASRDTSLPVGGGPDGYDPIQVKKDTVIWLGMFSMHRRKDVWGGDADVFKPERWESFDPGIAFSPFGAGNRACLGQQFAMNEASYFLVRMVQTFEKIEPFSAAPWKGRAAITLSLVDGCKVRLHRKTDPTWAVARSE